MTPTPDDPAIAVAGVSHRFGVHDVLPNVLQDVCFDVPRGALFGLIGHNGAGKSTLFRLMLGLIQPSAGTLRVLGTPTCAAAFRHTRRRIGYLPETFVTWDNLTGAEVLRLFADLKGVERGSCAALLELVGLRGAAGRAVHTYSKGMRQRLGLAQALLGDPELIFLDEPTNGLDPQGIAGFYAILGEVQQRGATIVITSHILAEIQERVDRLAILHGGRVAALGTLAQLRDGIALPLRIEAAIAADRHGPAVAALATLAARQGDGIAWDSTERGVAVRCPAADKMAVLATLLPHAADVTVREATLEQVFLGYGGGDVARV